MRTLSLPFFEQEGEDIVESLKIAARKNRFLASVIVAGLVLAVVVTIVNGVVSILKNLGAIP